MLELSCPLVSQPTHDALVSHLAMNGGLVADGAQFCNYVAADWERYLGAFARLPLPAVLWYPPPLADLLWIAGRGLANLRGRVAAFADSHPGPIGEQLMPAGPNTGPPGIFGGAE